MREKSSERVRISARRSLRHLDARWIYSVDHGKRTTWYDSRQEALQAALEICEPGVHRVYYHEFFAVPQEREISIDELRRMAKDAEEGGHDGHPF